MTPTISNQTSGTTNTQNQLLFVSDIIRRAYSKAGVTEGKQTPEMLTQAKQNLNLILQNLLNVGLPLFSIQPYYLGFNQGIVQYDLPESTYEVEECVWRTTTPLQYICTGGIDPQNLIAANYFAYATTTDFFLASTVLDGSPEYVNYMGFFFYGAQTVTLTITYSTDNVTYLPFDSIATTSYADGQWLWLSFSPGQTGYYFRVSINEGETLSLRAWYLSNLNSCTDLPIARINRDAYMSYPVKNQSGSPILYYFERTLTPRIFVWGQPNDVYNWQLFLRLKVQLQDVGALTNTLPCPPWYLHAIINLLAKELCLEANGTDMESLQIRYQILSAEADNALRNALSSNSDNAPLSLIPNFSCYTR